MGPFAHSNQKRFHASNRLKSFPRKKFGLPLHKGGKGEATETQIKDGGNSRHKGGMGGSDENPPKNINANKKNFKKRWWPSPQRGNGGERRGPTEKQI